MEALSHMLSLSDKSGSPDQAAACLVTIESCESKNNLAGTATSLERNQKLNRATTLLRAVTTCGRKRNESVRGDWQLESGALEETREDESQACCPSEEQYLFTVEVEEKSTVPFVVVRSVAAGGRALSLVMPRGQVLFHNHDNTPYAHWIVLEDQKKQLLLMNRKRPDMRLGPIRFRRHLSLATALGRVPEEQQRDLSSTKLHEMKEAACARNVSDSDSVPGSDEKEQLMREAKIVFQKLERLLGVSGSSAQTDRRAEDQHQQEEVSSDVDFPAASTSALHDGFVPTVRPKPRNGKKWFEKKKGRARKQKVSEGLAEVHRQSTGAQNSVSDGGEDADFTPTPGSTPTPRIQEEEDIVVAEAETSEAPTPAPQLRLPVPMQQNILAQIRQGVKLRPNTRGRRDNYEGEHENDAGVDNNNENLDPSFTPKTCEADRQSGLMSELKRSLAGRRKSMGEIISPNPSEADSYNWSPLSVCN